jgi:hypothetical protein
MLFYFASTQMEQQLKQRFWEEEKVSQLLQTSAFQIIPQISTFNSGI